MIEKLGAGNKRTLSSERASILILEESRKPGRGGGGDCGQVYIYVPVPKDELLNIAEAIFPDNAGHFVSPGVAGGRRCACVL